MLVYVKTGKSQFRSGSVFIHLLVADGLGEQVLSVSVRWRVILLAIFNTGLLFVGPTTGG